LARKAIFEKGPQLFMNFNYPFIVVWNEQFINHLAIRASEITKKNCENWELMHYSLLIFMSLFPGFHNSVLQAAAACTPLFKRERYSTCHI
jgi:hypothetical protein